MTGVQTCALPICVTRRPSPAGLPAPLSLPPAAQCSFSDQAPAGRRRRESRRRASSWEAVESDRPRREKRIEERQWVKVSERAEEGTKEGKKTFNLKFL